MPSVPWPNRQFALKIAVFAILGAITWVFFIDLCNLYFQCGCRSLWAGAATYCNIHQHGVKHCPFCVLPSYGFNALVAMILLVQGYFLRREKWLWAVISFPLVAALQALALGWYRGYWS